MMIELDVLEVTQQAFGLCKEEEAVAPTSARIYPFVETISESHPAEVQQGASAASKAPCMAIRCSTL
jgi:hypothetical protein